MIDIEKLRRLAQAATINTSLDVWLEFGNIVSDPNTIIELLDRLETVERNLSCCRAELTDLRSSMAYRSSLIGRIEAERDELLARNEEMEKQEPVAWIARGGYPVPLDELEWQLWYGSEKPTLSWVNQEMRPLYAIPGAKGEEK